MSKLYKLHHLPTGAIIHTNKSINTMTILCDRDSMNNPCYLIYLSSKRSDKPCHKTQYTENKYDCSVSCPFYNMKRLVPEEFEELEL